MNKAFSKTATVEPFSLPSTVFQETVGIVNEKSRLVSSIVDRKRPY